MPDTTLKIPAKPLHRPRLHPELREAMEKQPDLGITIIRHPLCVTVYTGPEQHSALNTTFMNKQMRVEKAFAERRYAQVPWLYERPFRLTSLWGLRWQLPPSKYWRLLMDLWVDAEVVSPHRLDWLNAITYSRLAYCRDRYFMNAQERRRLENLPPVVTIYRGVTNDPTRSTVRGISWTLDQKVADRFAHRFADPKMDFPHVLETQIPKDRIIAYTNRRREREVIIHPRNLPKNKNIKTTLAPAPPRNTVKEDPQAVALVNAAKALGIPASYPSKRPPTRVILNGTWRTLKQARAFLEGFVAATHHRPDVRMSDSVVRFLRQVAIPNDMAETRPKILLETLEHLREQAQQILDNLHKDQSPRTKAWNRAHVLMEHMVVTNPHTPGLAPTYKWPDESLRKWAADILSDYMRDTIHLPPVHKEGDNPAAIEHSAQFVPETDLPLVAGATTPSEGYQGLEPDQVIVDEFPPEGLPDLSPPARDKKETQTS